MKEQTIKPISGWPMLVIVLAAYAVSIYFFVQGVRSDIAAQAVGAVLGFSLTSLLCAGFFVVEPNGSRVLILFGKYVGTVRDDGFHWANPFYSKRPLSLRVRTLNGPTLKVNDDQGNPIEIAAVVVWQVVDTYEASFEVENFELFLGMQSETALRHCASIFPYDAEDDVISLRRNTEEVAHHLKEELGERLQRSGVSVLEARLSHLAYAPEIAGVMLRRQQATAVIAARQRIVDGAVGMVELALRRLETEGFVNLDDERKAAMVTNLMVVLCSEQAAQPVINSGTLYN